jgi:hypothetical protein
MKQRLFLRTKNSTTTCKLPKNKGRPNRDEGQFKKFVVYAHAYLFPAFAVPAYLIALGLAVGYLNLRDWLEKPQAISGARRAKGQKPP